MMVSNALTHRRGPLKPSKVCKPPPPPPPPEDPHVPGNITCRVLEDEPVIPPNADTNVAIQACHDGLPFDDPVDVVLTTDGGTFVQLLPVLNCRDDDEYERAEYTAPDYEGDFTITAVFTFSDTSTCTNHSGVDVEEENGNNGDG